MRVLVADADTAVRELIRQVAHTLWPGCEVAIAGAGATALRCFHAVGPDLIVLDAMLPTPNGFEVCRRVRSESSVPILMLTARPGLLEELQALDLGADDYLAKPIDQLKLRARLRALARRGGLARARDLIVDRNANEVRLGGKLVALTPTEYLVLETLARRPGTIVSHRTLLERVWGGEYAHDTHYLKVFMNRLRRKLGDDAEQPRYIQTCRGVGYRLLADR
jgi:two-component system response regulator MtrA